MRMKTNKNHPSNKPNTRSKTHGTCNGPLESFHSSVGWLASTQWLEPGASYVLEAHSRRTGNWRAVEMGYRYRTRECEQNTRIGIHEAEAYATIEEGARDMKGEMESLRDMKLDAAHSLIATALGSQPTKDDGGRRPQVVF